MKLLVTAWPTIDGEKLNPGDEIDIEDDGFARMLIRDGQARPAGTPEPMPVPARPEEPDNSAAAEPAEGAQTETARPSPEGEPVKPARGASKDEWVTYAEARGVPREEAEAMTRGDIAAKFAGT